LHRGPSSFPSHHDGPEGGIHPGSQRTERRRLEPGQRLHAGDIDRVKTLVPLLKETYESWNAHKAPKMGAALAYYTALSLAPLVMLGVALVGLVVDRDVARADIVAQFSTLVGSQGAATVEGILSQSAHREAGWWAAITGFVVLLVGASGVFVEL